MNQKRIETWVSGQLKDRIRAHTAHTVCWVISILIFLSFLTSMVPAEAGTVLPRMGAVIEIDQVTPKDPWEDQSSRLQWVLARLQNEGLRIWLLDPKVSAAGCKVIYLDGTAFRETLDSLKGKPTGILQSASRKLLRDDSPSRTVQTSPRISLKYHKSGSRRVVTVTPDLADCFNDYQAVRLLAGAILWLAGLPEDTPRIAPFPNGKRSAAIFIVHGEGNNETTEAFQNHFFNGPGALTYAVSEDAIRDYPLVVKSFAKSPLHEVAIHNHVHKQYGTQDKVLSTNVALHKEALEGHRPKGLVGGFYLHYFDDLREALVKHHFAWFLDKDLPYPLNIPAPPDSEPVIDITESLKPYEAGGGGRMPRPCGGKVRTGNDSRVKSPSALGTMYIWERSLNRTWSSFIMWKDSLTSGRQQLFVFKNSGETAGGPGSRSFRTMTVTSRCVLSLRRVD